MSKTKQRYQKKDHLAHILSRPDTYVGSLRQREEQHYVADKNYYISKKTVAVSPGILRIFVEPLSNMIDNWARSKKTPRNKVSEMRVTIDEKTGETSFWNDGMVIPIEIHDEEKCYIHSMIFGQLLTSENYDDDEDREDVSGRNGYGVKLSNIFSRQFTVEGLDSSKKKHLSQTWTDNMRTDLGAKVSKTKDKKGFTKVSYTPDFERFGLDGYTDDIISVYKKYLVDTAMITKVPIYFNDELIPVQSLKEYAQLYSDNPEQQTIYIKTADCEVVLAESNRFEQISFANGVYTSLGGTHVDAWAEELFRPILEKINKKGKPQLNLRDIKQFFRLFVVASVKKPEFESQSKHKLESPKVVATIKTSQLKTIMEWSVIDRIEEIIQAKELSKLKKVERKRGYTKVDSLDSANFEGGPKSTGCTLILVEGLSAKTYAVQGIDQGAFGKSGRDWFGIYALRGKVLNTRNASVDTISKNKVVTDIIKALGLKAGVDYTNDSNFKKLRYGRVMLTCDADVDGIHITALIQNLFHNLFPTLLQRKDAFITSMQTPIVRVFLSKTNNKLFYDESEYRKWVSKYMKKNPKKKIDKKYYKGLGTNNEEDITESFGKKLVEYKPDEKTFETMTKAFHTKYANNRKDWLAKYDPNNNVLKWYGDGEEINTVSLTDYIDTELIKYSHDDCRRSIPNLIDGLKEGARKVLFTCFLRNLRHTGKTLKVAQLAGSVAEKSGYHHGEQNLLSTITGMAASYVGSNNIPLLFRDGAFGTRLHGGKDAANGRYIFTKLDTLTRMIFRVEDDPLLKHRDDDGEKVEPNFYVPIIPMVLVNGVVGAIGTGWSCSIPNYDPLVLVEAVKIWIENREKSFVKQENTSISLYPELKPWYRGYHGRIESSQGKFISYGNIDRSGGKVIITELPIGVWTDKYKDTLESLHEKKEIKKFSNHSNPKIVKFEIIESDDGINCNIDNLKLKKTINTSNMCLFNDHDQLSKFDTAEEIISAFCEVRFSYYIKRKKHMLRKLERELMMMGNKKRFLIEVRDGDILLFDEKKGKRQSRKTADVVKELEERGYDRLEPEQKEGKEDEVEDEKETNDKGYNYLLSLQIRSITAERINKLKKDIESTIRDRDNLKATEEKDLWLNDLNEFEKEYKKWLTVIEKEKIKIKKDKKK